MSDNLHADAAAEIVATIRIDEDTSDSMKLKIAAIKAQLAVAYEIRMQRMATDRYAELAGLVTEDDLEDL